jgi:hypothetical protein
MANYANDSTLELNQRIRAVLEEAPSDATAELQIQKSRGGYKGFLKVYSRQRKFVGGAESRSFADVVEDLFREVRQQIKEWKRDRFGELQEAE